MRAVLPWSDQAIPMRPPIVRDTVGGSRRAQLPRREMVPEATLTSALAIYEAENLGAVMATFNVSEATAHRWVRRAQGR